MEIPEQVSFKYYQIKLPDFNHISNLGVWNWYPFFNHVFRHRHALVECMSKNLSFKDKDHKSFKEIRNAIEFYTGVCVDINHSVFENSYAYNKFIEALYNYAVELVKFIYTSDSLIDLYIKVGAGIIAYLDNSTTCIFIYAEYNPYIRHENPFQIT